MYKGHSCHNPAGKRSWQVNFRARTVPDRHMLYWGPLEGSTWKLMSTVQVIQYQALFLDQPWIWFHKVSALNPASLLLDKDPVELMHDCLEVIEPIQSNRPDLTNVLLATPDQVLFIDESRFVQDWVRYARAAVVTQDNIWAQSFTVFKHGNLSSMNWAFSFDSSTHLGEDKAVTTYTNS